MRNFQRTINCEGKLSGLGLHTGKKATLKFIPALINHGIKFQRIDLENKPIINADVDNVIAVERGTTLSQNNAKVSTVEHLLAAIVGLEIDNILGKIRKDERYIGPVFDESGMEFYLVYNPVIKTFHYVVNEQSPIPDVLTVSRISNNILINIFLVYFCYIVV